MVKVRVPLELHVMMLLTVSTDEQPPKDKAFRKYAAAVEKTLSLFDTALDEWADYISFLNKLLKVRIPRLAFYEPDSAAC